MAKPVTARQAGRQSSGSDGPEPVRVLTHGGLFLTQNDGPAPSASLTRLNQGHPLMPWNVCWHGPESVTVRLHVRNNATTLCSCHIPACSCTSHAAYLRNEHELRQSASPILALCLQRFPQCWCPRLLDPTASPPASLTTRPAGDARPARTERDTRARARRTCRCRCMVKAKFALTSARQPSRIARHKQQPACCRHAARLTCRAGEQPASRSGLALAAISGPECQRAKPPQLASQVGLQWFLV